MIMADKNPLQPSGGSPGQEDRLRAATEIQSAVVPEDYPATEREGQVAITGKGKPRGKGAANK